MALKLVVQRVSELVCQTVVKKADWWVSNWAEHLANGRAGMKVDWMVDLMASKLVVQKVEMMVEKMAF